MIKHTTRKHDFGELGSIRVDFCVEAEGHSISITKQQYGVFNDKHGQFTFNVVKEIEYNSTIITHPKTS
jgi:hypothetical protein